MNASTEALRDVLDAIDRIRLYMEEGREDFFEQPLIQEAICRNLEVVRGVCGSLPSSMRSRFRLLCPKSQPTGLGDPIQEFFGGGRVQLWSMLEEELSDLRDRIEELLAVSVDSD
jgi:uncharacterized protein with HEPN domain